MKLYTKKELNDILERHKKWINKEIGGVHADLSDVDLSGTNLSGTNLSGANLNSANLSHAYLISTDLRSADLNGADLRSADLNGADLSNAWLSDVDLRGADLTNANLTDVRLWDFIKNYWTRTTPILFKCLNLNIGKIFKVKSTGKLGFVLPYQVFEGWNRGFLDGQVVEFEMSEEVYIQGNP